MGIEKKKLSELVKTIAVLSISLGLAVMILAVSVVTGFQREIRDKVIGFGSHIQITNFDYNVSYEARPISKNQDFYPGIANQIPGIKHIQVFATKPGIIKTDDEIHGVIFKGIGSDFDWEFFAGKLVSGMLINISDTVRSNEIIISKYISSLLKLNTGDDVVLYFIQDPPRVRRFQIAGIYDTGMEELDRIFVIGDIAHLQRLNDWSDDQVGGFEILIHNYRDIDRINELVLENIPYTLLSRTIKDIYPQIFDWLALLDMNVYVIIFIMILVAGINMITTLLISVLEKTNLIGILKAIGADNRLVRKIFLYHAGVMIFKGLILGNIIGIGITLLQKHTGLIKLSQESYFVDVVPVNIEPLLILALNTGTFLICMAILLIPSYIISKVSPVKAITFR
jgi:lipoprotein-releasing system permease protein